MIRWRERDFHKFLYTYFCPIKLPPHQNSVFLGPCKKIAANHGHCPLLDSTPPTILPELYSCCPHSSGSTKFELINSSEGGRFEILPKLSRALEGVCVTVLDIVKTGTRGRCEVVVVVVVEGVVMGLKNKLGRLVVARVVNLSGRCVVEVDAAAAFSDIGQHTPGTNKLLKHSDSRRCVKSNKSAGQLLKSSHFPKRPSGVRHRFSPSLLW